jgi:glycopeptide antibiotics resistance protein
VSCLRVTIVFLPDPPSRRIRIGKIDHDVTQALSALASLSIEAAQLSSYLAFNNGRSTDVNDVIANTLGGVIGFVLVRLALRNASLRATLHGMALPHSAVGAPAGQYGLAFASR